MVHTQRYADGRLRDGAHRLHAVIRSDVTVEVAVYTVEHREPGTVRLARRASDSMVTISNRLSRIRTASRKRDAAAPVVALRPLDD
ncbi:MAG: hypothetical protein QOH91_3820 [Mycobacterium sp.]|jgi:hypothetical protein|nr:hypothetical protein [Mycobacterium sp.]